MALCAWLAAALFSPPAASAAAEAPPAAPLRVRGIVLRRETPLEPRAIPASAVDGKRLSAAETGGEPGLFFAAGDGYAFLSPAYAQPFSVERTEALLAAAPGEDAGPLLVTGTAVWAAVLIEDGEAPPVGARCRVRFDGADRPCEAAVEESASDGARSALLLRLTEGLDYLCRVRFVTGTIENERILPPPAGGGGIRRLTQAG